MVPVYRSSSTPLQWAAAAAAAVATAVSSKNQVTILSSCPHKLPGGLALLQRLLRDSLRLASSTTASSTRQTTHCADAPTSCSVLMPPQAAWRPDTATSVKA
jgi:hypothetical protein